MRLPQVIIFLLGFFTLAHAFAIPSLPDFSSTSQDLFKRKGGGGGGGKGGGSSSSSSSSGGSSSSSGGSSSGGSSSSGSSSSGSRGGSGSSGSGSSSSGSTSSGGSSSSGSSGSRGYGATSPSFGGGRYYGGGASTAYSAGRTTPGGLAPAGLLAGGAAALLLFPAAAFAYGAWSYPYHHTWTYYNTTSNATETRPVECICAQYSQCGCDEDNTNQTYINDVANDADVAKVANIDGKSTLVIDGTVANATSNDNAPTGAGAQISVRGSKWLFAAAGVAYAALLL